MSDLNSNSGVLTTHFIPEELPREEFTDSKLISDALAIRAAISQT